LTWLLAGAAEFRRFGRVAAFDESNPVAIWRLAALAVMVEQDADRLREHLRLSNDEHKKLVAYARLLAVLKTWVLPLDATAIRRLVADHGIETPSVVLAATRGEPSPVIKDDGVDALERYRSGAENIPVFPLRGADLVARGIPKGPKVGEILAQARQAWLAEGCRTDGAYAKDLLERVAGRA
ncbi:MAG TPA: CCA tRNA nucleotidyltransferase, partial [Microvirga sp.]|nr:CCA tRNA nucleotidyltransferase [Microvirga sp.]